MPIRVDHLSLSTEAERVIVDVRLAPSSQAAVGTTGELRVVLARHDDVAVQWWADLGCRWAVDHWQGELNSARTARPRLVEIARITVSGGAEAVLTARPLYLERAEDGPWQSGTQAEAERQHLANAREARFSQPLVSAGASGATTFHVVMTADNIHLTQNWRVPGLSVVRLENSTLGGDLIQVLNSAAAQLGFATGPDPAALLALIRRQRPAAILEAKQVVADTADAAMAEARRAALLLLDLAALRRGAAPRLLAGYVGQVGADGATGVAKFWVEGSGYTGNLLGGFISGEDPTSLLQQWHGAERDARARLWMSLYGDALAEERWDYQIFRCFNLLEGIAAEILPAGVTVTDESGAPLMQANGKPYTTDQARGKVFALLKHGAALSQQALQNFAAGRGRTPWEETEVWVAVRNAVAHRGAWEQSLGSTISIRDQRIEEQLLWVAHDGTILGGAHAELRCIRATVEMVLYLALAGRL